MSIIDIPALVILILLGFGELWVFTRNEPGERWSAQLLVIMGTAFTVGVFGMLFWW